MRNSSNGKRGIAIFLCAALAIAPVAGCATAGGEQAGGGTAAGAGIGAVAGGIAGSLLGAKGRRTEGMLIGAVAGAAIGALVGNYYDKKVRSREDSMKKVGYKAGGGDQVVIGQAVVAPDTVKVGGKVRSRVEYDVVTAEPDQKVPVKEVRQLIYQGKPVSDPVERTVERASGGYHSTFDFEVPKAATPGEYSVATQVQASGKAQTAQSKLIVEKI